MDTSPRVLLIEDEPLIAMSIQNALEDSGYRVELAFDGDGALRYLSRQHDLSGIVTDIRLGRGPDGWEVARRARDAEPTLPVVYVSGDCAHDFSQQGVPGSMMLQKPFGMPELLAAVAAVIRRSATSN